VGPFQQIARVLAVVRLPVQGSDSARLLARREYTGADAARDDAAWSAG
jgi:hypothetical protein